MPLCQVFKLIQQLCSQQLTQTLLQHQPCSQKLNQQCNQPVALATGVQADATPALQPDTVLQEPNSPAQQAPAMQPNPPVTPQTSMALAVIQPDQQQAQAQAHPQPDPTQPQHEQRPSILRNRQVSFAAGTSPPAPLPNAIQAVPTPVSNAGQYLIQEIHMPEVESVGALADQHPVLVARIFSPHLLNSFQVTCASPRTQRPYPCKKKQISTLSRAVKKQKTAQLTS